MTSWPFFASMVARKPHKSGARSASSAAAHGAGAGVSVFPGAAAFFQHIADLHNAVRTHALGCAALRAALHDRYPRPRVAVRPL